MKLGFLAVIVAFVEPAPSISKVKTVDGTRARGVTWRRIVLIRLQTQKKAERQR